MSHPLIHSFLNLHIIRRIPRKAAQRGTKAGGISEGTRHVATQEKRDAEFNDAKTDLDENALLAQPCQPALDKAVEKMIPLQLPLAAFRNMETGQDDGRKRQITGQEEPFRVKPEKKGRGNKQGLDDIDDEDGLGMIEPEAYQLVVEMVLVGRKERPPLRNPLRHHRKRVEHRKTQDHERQKGTQGGLALGKRQRQADGRKTEKLAARVSHEKLGRIGVVPQETEYGAGKGQGKEAQRKVFLKIGKVRQASRS